MSFLRETYQMGSNQSSVADSDRGYFLANSEIPISSDTHVNNSNSNTFQTGEAIQIFNFAS